MGLLKVLINHPDIPYSTLDDTSDGETPVPTTRQPTARKRDAHDHVNARYWRRRVRVPRRALVDSRD